MIPFTTTTVTIERPASTSLDSLEPVSYVVVASRVPCVLNGLSGSETQVSGSQIVRTASADFNPGVDLRSYDRVTDEITGDRFEVGDVWNRVGFGLDHMKCTLRKVAGANA